MRRRYFEGEKRELVGSLFVSMAAAVQRPAEQLPKIENNMLEKPSVKEGFSLTHP